MGELIALLDSATGHLDGATGLTAAYRACNAAWCDAENLIDFVTVTSDVYPEPQAYCEEEEVEWLASFEAERPDPSSRRPAGGTAPRAARKPGSVEGKEVLNFLVIPGC